MAKLVATLQNLLLKKFESLNIGSIFIYSAPGPNGDIAQQVILEVEE
jgi:hypothetical protein